MAFRHGTNYACLVKKCKCPECRAWWAAWQRNYRDERSRRTGEAFSGSKGGWVPGKPCACGCGLALPATSQKKYKRGHELKSAEDLAWAEAGLSAHPEGE